MNENVKSLTLYVSNFEIIIIYKSRSLKTGMMTQIDIFKVLNINVADEELEETIFQAFEKCNKELPDDDDKRSPVEKYLKVRGWNKATKGFKCINVVWDFEEGYLVTPTVRTPKKGYDFMKYIELGFEPKKGEIAKAIREAIVLSKLDE